jgi:hypothetical protein
MSYRYDKSTGDIIIDGFENGIANSPYEGIADMRNIDNVTIPGEASVALSTEAMITQAPITNATFTVNATGGGSVIFASTENSGWSNGATSRTVNKPSGLAVGDIMIAHLAVGTGFVTITPPSGFSSFGYSTNPSGDVSSFYYRKIADSGDVAATNFTFSWVGSVACWVSMNRITGGDTNFSNWQWGGDDKTASNTAIPSINATITPTASNLLLQMWVSTDDGSGTSGYAIVTSNPSWTEAYDVIQGGAPRSASLAWAVRTQSTATGNVSCIGSSGSGDWTLGFLAIPPTGTSSPIFNYSGTPALEENTAITVSNSGGSLPSGLSANTAYYIKAVSGTTFTVSAVSAGGAELSLSSAGIGTQTFSTINMGTPNYFASGQVVSPELASYIYLYFLVDSNGRCWVYDTSVLGSSNKWVYMHNRASEGGSESGNGLVVYKGYLFWFSDTEINVINMADLSLGLPTLAYLTTASSWNLDWQTDLSNEGLSNISHQAILAVNDDSVYFCNGQNVGSILTAISIGNVPPAREDGQIFNIASTHSIATGSTSSGSANITTGSAFFDETDVGAVITGTNIPTGTYIKSVTSSTAAVMSANATGTGSSLTFTITSGYVYNAEALAIPSNDITTCLAELGSNLLVGGVNNAIYPWDRVSTSYSTAILCSENYIKRMVTVNTTTFIFCGYKGRAYQTNGSNVSGFWEVPEYLSNTTNPYFQWTDAVFNRNQLYFGFQVFENDGTTINQYGGMWSIDLAEGAGKLQNQMSYGAYSGYVNALWQNRGLAPNERPVDDGYGLFMGWNDGTSGGVDKGISDPYTQGEAYVVSDMMNVGQFLTKQTPSNLEFKIARPLVTGESVALAYRENINDSFTDVPITQGGTVGELSGIATVNFQNVQWLQTKATLTSTVTNPSFVRLVELRVR